MPITAYSKTFERELDVLQLQNLFNQSTLSSKYSFNDFVKVDIECPACNTKGGYVVKEGVSIKMNKVVSQTHFAFRDTNGRDAHRNFCDFYKGQDKVITCTNDVQINFKSSNSEVTKVIRTMACIAIENDLITQKDMRDMRQWFLELRSGGDLVIRVNRHLPHIIRAAVTRRKGHSDNYEYHPNPMDDQWFDIDDEVYASLHFQLSLLKKNSIRIEDIYSIRRKKVLNKVNKIIASESGLVSFDREVLEQNYRLATSLSLEIRKQNETLRRYLSQSVLAVRGNNPLMAFSALLLFVSGWDKQRALELLTKILEIDQVNNLELGNIIGLNPFIHFDAWLFLKTVNEIRVPYNLDELYEMEKKRLQKYYKLDLSTEG
ncbi:conserved hypothetical protein [Vibrio chagasii]|nr:conserved hypothetical protein [Vibrio chagasii]CAH6865529.1 conserved hypothetical protein [Vibrio chagasii]CAH6868320.1 conserved hypothetical protein [Vibrio chagasii]CAH7247725.1 conserved hypothetical protein [Vibrio chagasii]